MSDMIKSIRIILLAVVLLLSVPSLLRAQAWMFDIPSVEALIDDHKGQRAVLIARSAIETTNEKLHKNLAAVGVSYDSLNVQLDKYSKCFDIIDIIFTSGQLVINVRQTYNDVKYKVGLLEDLIGDFVADYTLKGDVMQSDLTIVNACREAVQSVVNDGDAIITSLVELSQYALGLRHMTTADLLLVIEKLNSSFEGIRGAVDHAYFVIWRYIQLRTYYVKRAILMAHRPEALCPDALSRWMESARRACAPLTGGN